MTTKKTTKAATKKTEVKETKAQEEATNKTVGQIIVERLDNSAKDQVLMALIGDVEYRKTRELKKHGKDIPESNEKMAELLIKRLGNKIARANAPSLF